MNFLKRTWAEIDISALLNNYEIVKKMANGKKIIAVVKADAYGHGEKSVALALEKAGVECFAVSNLEEAVSLRNYGIKGEIIILGYTPPEMAKDISKYDIMQCLFSTEYATALSENAVKDGVCVKVHLKLDTGMGRIGFDCRSDELCGVNAAIEAARLPGFSCVGVFTHFAVADRTPKTEDGFTKQQYDRFVNAVEKLENSGISFDYIHCFNSAAIINDIDNKCNYCRAGIIMYGLTPDISMPVNENIVPVMTLKSVISMVKDIRVGESVNYGRTFIAEKPTRVATVTIGYADGYPRILSGRGYVFVNGKRANIIGRVCMDQLAIDVTDIDVKMGDNVELFGKNLSVDELAQTAQTIGYELICSVAPRVPRIEI